MDMLKIKIENLDLNAIMKKVQRNTGLEDSLLEKAESLYKQYLYLRAKYPTKTIVPPKLADAVWHEHIMASKKYMDDCNAVFGEYLHHNETDDEAFLQVGWENTQQLFLQEFNVDVIKSGYTAAACG